MRPDNIKECTLDIAHEADKMAARPYSLFFDSNRPQHPESKWSFLCYNPIETITAKNGIITHNGAVINDTDIFNFLQTRLNAYDFQDSSDIPFTGGIAGYWGYDLGRDLENIADNTLDDLNLPDLCIGIYTDVIAHNHEQNKTWQISEPPQSYPKLKRSPQTTSVDFKAKKSDEDYKGDIQKIIGYIYAGEIYQANMSRRFDSVLPENFNSYTHYKSMRGVNPAPFSAYMNFGTFQLGSCSPERFLKLSGNHIETIPIKGTLPAHKNSDILKNSLKDRAENLMIVDLLRNDISKVCTPHSIKVPALCEIETFEGVHHMVSTVTGELNKNETALSLLKSCFPGGSITGAPKIRAMQIIEDLEETRRGPYCGAMGYVDFNGNMDTNIIIRTVIYQDGKAYLQTGSGIVSDSDPAQELQEGLDKASKIFESFQSPNKESAA